MEETLKMAVKINMPGGFISPGDLYEILTIAASAGAEDLKFANRQHLYFSIEKPKLEDLETSMMQAEIAYEINKQDYPNVMSSYVADHIFNQEGWLKEGVYKDIFDLLNYRPRLKINLIDSTQTFVPFFSGHLNFIASDVTNYWFLYVRFPKTGKLYASPFLIYSEDIPLVAQIAEQMIIDGPFTYQHDDVLNERLFFDKLMQKSKVTIQPVISPLKLPKFVLPYYEGFNQYANKKHWLGIYRRNEDFGIDFLKDICSLCLKQRIGQLYITPWKSLLIKGIDDDNRTEWSTILNRYRLNIRHAANELNWQIEDLCAEALDLKKQLVREFEEADLRTFKLCFAIKTKPKTGLSGSVVVKKIKADLFEIWHTGDFNPNTNDCVLYKKSVPKKDLGCHLINLCISFYGTLASTDVLHPEATRQPEQVPEEMHLVHQCQNCLTIYDSNFGDSNNGIGKGVAFETLNNYKCPVCESTKELFLPVNRRQLTIAN